jgi:hypothetical protein
LGIDRLAEDNPFYSQCRPAVSNVPRYIIRENEPFLQTIVNTSLEERLPSPPEEQQTGALSVYSTGEMMSSDVFWGESNPT